jgi:hypothetical protein
LRRVGCGASAEEGEADRDRAHLLDRHEVPVEADGLQCGAGHVVEDVPGQCILAAEDRTGNLGQTLSRLGLHSAFRLSSRLGEVVGKPVVVAVVAHLAGHQRVEAEHLLEVLIGQRANGSGRICGRRWSRRSASTGERQQGEDQGRWKPHGLGHPVVSARPSTAMQRPGTDPPRALDPVHHVLPRASAGGTRK